MPAPICVECQVECVCQKNEQLFHDVKTDEWPSTYWLGDVFECPCCKWRVAIGFGVNVNSQRMKQLWELARNPNNSICFAHTKEQLDEYADQFPAISGSGVTER